MDSDKRLIDFWIDSEEKKMQERQNLPPRPMGSPLMRIVQDSFFGWIMYLMLLIVMFMGVYPYAQEVSVSQEIETRYNKTEDFSGPYVGAPAQNIEMPDSWTAPRPIQVWNTGCCCDSNTVLLNQIYQNQLFNDVQNRPSTIKEIHNSTFKSSSSLNNLINGR